MDTQSSRWARIEVNVNLPRTVKPYKKNNPNWFAHFCRLPCDQKQFCYSGHYYTAPCFFLITFYWRQKDSVLISTTFRGTNFSSSVIHMRGYSVQLHSTFNVDQQYKSQQKYSSCTYEGIETRLPCLVIYGVAVLTRLSRFTTKWGIRSKTRSTTFGTAFNPRSTYRIELRSETYWNFTQIWKCQWILVKYPNTAHLGAFTKLQKANISFVVPVSVEQLDYSTSKYISLN
jgi:hypothetical protein